MNHTQNRYIRDTDAWVEQFVIGLGLCPFASAPFRAQSISYSVVLSSDATTILENFLREVRSLKDKISDKNATSLIILPALDHSFQEFLDVYDLAELLLEDGLFDEHVQLASFHPLYQFEGNSPDDVSNYTNRSPHSIIHLLRVKEVEEATKLHPDTGKIPENNIARMRAMGLSNIQEKLERLKRE